MLINGHIDVVVEAPQVRLIATFPDQIGAKFLTVVSTFDTATRRVERHIRFCAGLGNRHKTFGFDDIQGVGLKEFIDNEPGGDSSYLPVITLVSGQRQ